jgi:hypothetical protein
MQMPDNNPLTIHNHIDGTLDFSSDIAMPLDFNASVDGSAVTAECAEPRRGLTQSRNSAPSLVLCGDKSLDFQTVPPDTLVTRQPLRCKRINITAA